MGTIKVSICLATYNKSEYLADTLKSIYRQLIPFNFETIVVDDGSPDDGNTKSVCDAFPVQYIRVDRKPGYFNPARARNIAYKRARGDVIICQSDDVIHNSQHTVDRLVEELEPSHFVIATVYNVDGNGERYSDLKGRGYGDQLVEYTNPQNKRPLFFLGALCRHDLYAVGGNDEEFIDPSREDVWFALCLMRGLGLKPIFSDVVGLHRHHPHIQDRKALQRSRVLFQRKLRAAVDGSGQWQAAGGPWPCNPAVEGCSPHPPTQRVSSLRPVAGGYG